VTADQSFFIKVGEESEIALANAIDDDACSLFAQAGIRVDFPPEHPFVQREVARWMAAARAKRLRFACAPSGEPVGFAAMDYVDAKPFLHQLSVRPAWGRRGIGRQLIAAAIDWARPQGELWLTTYRHVPWNGPWYARLGFIESDAAEWGPTLRSLVADERANLAASEHRMVMRLRITEP
jgi:GNAT superfamily N-acetyltransferase